MVKQENRYFAVTTPGLEDVCAQEIECLGLGPIKVLPGGVEFAGGLREMYLANLWLRSASRILVRADEVLARDFPTLFKKLQRLPWGRFITPGSAFKVRVTCHRSRLSHSDRVAQTCREAIDKALGAESQDAGPVSVLLRLENDRCQVSLDSSGDLLYRRGYRRANVAAPLRETLAAGCLLALGYDGSQPLVDAMTGSGSFAIEGALIAKNRAPGIERTFSFMQWPKFRAGLWRQLCDEARRAERQDGVAPIIAVDSNPKAIEAAQQNAAAAGVADIVSLKCQLMQNLAAECSSGLIICNPPYGERIGRKAELRALYHAIGHAYGETFAGWQGALVCPDSELVRSSKIDFNPLLRFSNGGIRVALWKKNRSDGNPLT
ncbi:putative N6-adenine-specific DNA methylase [Malonomonas rubra DSM 5091]|uniref:Putative N6-adenine-specific DNA methylase n=1 Tax=Malonomonas rubra DSM 5091 TaxID=1122189 RepID=A0A1M6E9S8_MALRU|nr:methyltransferase [Malonomonas rubra]SHI82173.1 putative N6-adenine-specific DNA methylase [Malonomonas rubra DSM 5091]